MATTTLDAEVDDFFHRCGLSSAGRSECDEYVHALFAGELVTPSTSQGWCSYTVLVGDNLIVQFRPSQYQLDMPTVRVAKKVYGRHAPNVEILETQQASGLLVYLMFRMQGVSLRTSRLLACPTPSNTSLQRHISLCEGFADFLAQAWMNSPSDIPMGKVGSSLQSRLESLSIDLPPRFRSAAKGLLHNLPRIVTLPWILTHGDLVASNFMVDPASGYLFGLVDWAEAEILPFGTCLYGLESLLGEMTADGFVYASSAAIGRERFWKRLQERVPEVFIEPNLETVMLARDMGVLLWYGFAFDEGAINRVVEEGRDADEIRYLETFLTI
jgi:hypothetical protein